MEALWAGCEPGGAGMTGREVLAALAGRDLAYTTVMTVLDRLAGKRMALRERDGQAWRYRPAAPREAYVAQLMLEALDLAEPAGQAGQAGQAGIGPAGDGRGGDGRGGDGRGGRGAALVRFARSVTGEDAELLRQALIEQARRTSDAGPGS